MPARLYARPVAASADTIFAVKLRLHARIADVPADQWNALVRGRYPFLRHEFLHAMETHGCVGEEAGWIPRHIALYDAEDRLLGAMPLYEKHNSWGEFVFDYAWADAYHRAGLNYYPKLVNAVPFTPATGQRLLLPEGDESALVAARLLDGSRQVMRQGEFSGVHSLFLDARDFALLSSEEALLRIDCQFHWHNHGYADFDAFLATLRPKKRKNIRQERRRVADAGVRLRRLDGHSASEQDWRDFTRLYRGIYDRKFGAPAFNLAFFLAVAEALPDQVLLVLAEAGGETVAGALMYHDDHTLYGRHWGCDRYFDGLHFEACYYQGIDFCIERGIALFDPGAQGEHKVARGFVPTETRSLHWIAEDPFRHAIADFVSRERRGVRGYMQAVEAHSPYRPAGESCGG